MFFRAAPSYKFVAKLIENVIILSIQEDLYLFLHYMMFVQYPPGYDIVASFMLRKPASFLEDHLLQLEGDIFDEMSFPSVKVLLLTLSRLFRFWIYIPVY